MKIRPVGAEMFHVDRRTYGQTDRRTTTMNLIVAFRNLTKAPETEDKNLEMSLALQTGDTVRNRAKFETTHTDHIRQWTARIGIFV